MSTFKLDIPESKDDVMLIDIHYHRPSKYYDWTDQLQIIYKVISTGEKKVLNIDNPTMDIYFCKPGYENRVYQEFMPIEHLDKVTVLYRDVELEIAKRAGERYLNEYYDNQKTGKRQHNKNLHWKYPNVYGSDYDIVEWYKIMWAIHYDNDAPKLITRAFFDIEVNIYKLKGFPQDGERPINVITVADPDEMRSFAFILREPMNMKNVTAFEDNLDSFIEELEAEFTEIYGELEYLFYFYDNEAEMLADFILLLRTLNKDFVEVWNMDFDIPYINARAEVLGFDPTMLWCDPDFDRQTCYYKKSRFFEVVSRDSKFDVSMKTRFLDQMVLYAAMRKGQGTLRSNNLNAIGKEELEDEKIDYGEAANLGELQMMDFPRYIKYAIKDTLMQMGIDNKTGDTEGLYTRALGNCISYPNAFKQTKFLENRAYLEYYKQGLIIGNNTNIDYSVPYGELPAKEDGEDDDESYDGGLVTDPKLNGNNGIEALGGQQSKYVYKDVADMDFGSMYPNTINAMNISKNSMIGKLVFDTLPENMAFNPEEGAIDRGHEFIEDYLTAGPVVLGSKWFNLPTTEQLINGLLEKEEK